MPRKGPAPKRPVVNDPVYGAPIVTSLVNKILVDGKKSLAESIVYGALRGVEAKNGQDAVATLKKALDNVRPTLEVRSRRVGGSTYQVPVEVKPHRANTLALRWLTSYAKSRREKTMTERLTNEILDASNGLGAVAQLHTSDLAHRRVRLLGGGGVHAGAHAGLLRVRLQGGRLGLRDLGRASLANQLLNSWHVLSS